MAGRDKNIKFSHPGNIVMIPFTLTIDQMSTSHPGALIEVPPEFHHVMENGTTIIPVWYIKEHGGNLYLDADIKVIIPKDSDNDNCQITHSFYLISPKKVMSRDKMTYDDIFYHQFRATSRTYSYDNMHDLGGSGPGPFSYKPGVSNMSISGLKTSEYLFGNEEIKLVVLLQNITFYISKHKLAKKIFEYVKPDLFKEQIKSQKKYYKQLLDQNIALKEQNKTLQGELVIAEKDIANNHLYNTNNAENTRLTQEIDQIQTMMRSDDERATELKERLKNNNFIRFINNIDSLSHREIVEQLNKLSNAELVDVAAKLIRLKQNTMVECIDGELCGFCFEKEKNAIITPCNHRFFCNECTSTFASKYKLCPLCCQPYTSIVNIILH